MLRKCLLAALVIAAELVLTIAMAAAFEDSKYPDWSGQWRRPSGVGDPMGPEPSRQVSPRRRH